MRMREGRYLSGRNQGALSVNQAAGTPTIGPKHAPLRLSRSEHEINRAPRKRHALWEKRDRSASTSEYWARHVTAADVRCDRTAMAASLLLASRIHADHRESAQWAKSLLVTLPGPACRARSPRRGSVRRSSSSRRHHSMPRGTAYSRRCQCRPR